MEAAVQMEPVNFSKIVNFSSLTKLNFLMGNIAFLPIWQHLGIKPLTFCKSAFILAMKLAVRKKTI